MTESLAGYFLRTGACRTSQPDHDRQCPIRKMQPKVQFLPLASPNERSTGVASWSSLVGEYMTGPWYNVIIVAPATQHAVPSTFAIPSFLSILTFSILQNHNRAFYYPSCCVIPVKQTLHCKYIYSLHILLILQKDFVHGLLCTYF